LTEFISYVRVTWTRCVLWANVQPHVVQSGLWIELSLSQCTPQWKYRVRASLSRSQLADIQRKKRATPAGELELEDNDRYLKVSFAMSFRNPGILVELPKAICGYTVEAPPHGRMRDELLNGEIFYSLREAQIIIESWRKHYNTKRPHSALGHRPPAAEAIIPMDQRPIMH
jgi:transposase InsO family protein